MELNADLLSVIITYAPWNTMIGVLTTSASLAGRLYIPYIWQQKSYYETRHLTVNHNLIQNWYVYWSTVSRTFSGYLYFGNYNNQVARMNPDTTLREWELVTPFQVVYAAGFTFDGDTVRTVLYYQIDQDVYVTVGRRTFSVGSFVGVTRRVVATHANELYVLTDRGQIYMCSDVFAKQPELTPVTNEPSDLVDIYYGTVSLVQLSRDGRLSYRQVSTPYSNYGPYGILPKNIAPVVGIGGLLSSIVPTPLVGLPGFALLTVDGRFYSYRLSLTHEYITKITNEQVRIDALDINAEIHLSKSTDNYFSLSTSLFINASSPPATMLHLTHYRTIIRVNNDADSITKTTRPRSIRPSDVSTFATPTEHTQVEADVMINVSGTIYFIGTLKS